MPELSFMFLCNSQNHNGRACKIKTLCVHHASMALKGSQSYPKRDWLMKNSEVGGQIYRAGTGRLLLTPSIPTTHGTSIWTTAT
ncbi:MAG: hypothetical protein L3V56_05135 [Candidatus Magnetoovum sp. WYHC-5]|nr:hypothetical protein [Candidatus Magnetoovum sp. WYHC-5]